jgi:uncharacterized membrane protein
MIHKLNSSSYKWIALNLSWSMILGLILPRTPSWGLSVVVGLVVLMIPLLYLLLFERSQLAIKKFFQKASGENTWLIALPTISIVVIFTNIIRALGKKLPTNILEYTLLTVALTWGWFEIAVRSGKHWQAQLSFNSFQATALVISLSVIGIVIGWSIHLSLDGQVLGWLIVLLIASIVAACIPNK